MSRPGVLIFAHDNGYIDYTGLAAWSAARINRHLGLPVSIVTDKAPRNAECFDEIILHDAGHNSMRNAVPWRNMGRCMANRLSPYDPTLLLDADFVVCSDQLRALFDCDQTILSSRWAFDVTGIRNYDDLNFFGQHNMPSAWATVMFWRRSVAADLIFDMMIMIQEHWQHYVDLYGITDPKFRNDYALAIASNTVMGHQGSWPAIPWPMPNLDHGCEITQVEQDVFDVRYHDQQRKPKRTVLAGLDFHAMNKKNLETIIAAS